MALNKKDLVFGIMYIVLAKQIHLWLTNKGFGGKFINHYPGKCTTIEGIKCGSEKVIVTNDGLAFITNGLKLGTNCNKEYLRGEIFLFDFATPQKNVIKLNIKNVSGEFIRSFDPHGMDILEDDSNDSIKLFVINHAYQNDSIEIFQYFRRSPSELTHVSTIHSEKFVCLNDITVIGKDEFYVTNFNKFCHSPYSKFLIPVELIFGLSTSNVVYFNQGFSAIAVHGSLLNGIAHSKDKDFIYVVSSATSSVTAYKRHNGGKLEHFKQIHVGYFPDNVYVESESGDLYIGQGKDFFGFSYLLANETSYVSSSAVKVVSPLEKHPKVFEVLHDDGSNFIHSASSAVRFGKQYLFGSPYDKLGYCDARKENTTFKALK